MARILGVALSIGSAKAWVTTDPWFDQYPQTDGYLASDGHVNRLPLRLTSHETIIYGTAELAPVLRSFKDEDFVPLTVGGKVPLQMWFNNFTDTDCGDAEVRNPYLETWYSLPVVPRDSPVDLPYTSDMDLIVSDPRALVWVHRVICGDTPGHEGPAMAAISGGREIWGYPKHPTLANIEYEYEGDDHVHFKATHRGLPSVELKMKLPEKTEGVIELPLEAATDVDTCVSGPRWLVKQTRYGQAFKCTEYIAPWDSKTDHLRVGWDAWYGLLLQSFRFQPKLKVHSTDFKIVAMKPAGWLAPNSTTVV